MVAPATNGAAAANGGRVLKLKKPITTHKGPTHELVFHPLTAGTLMRMQKLPYTIVGKPDGSRFAEVDFQLLGKYVEDLTGVESGLLEAMHPGDFSQCLGIVQEMIEAAGNS